MPLKPETIARIQGILDGTITVKADASTPASINGLNSGTRSRIQELLSRPQSAMATPYTLHEEPVMSQAPDAQELSNADTVITALANAGYGDYSGLRTQIALEVYTNGHYNGNWDVVFCPEDHGSDLPEFRVIQEDEYDQHMDEDPDKPDADDMVSDVPNGYLWMY